MTNFTNTANTIGWAFPYASQRMPVIARNVVATSQPLAAQAGLQAMVRGGNAIDAAIAAAITLTVVEPNNNGVGSDAFAIVWDGAQLHGLNASGRAPAAWTRARFAGRERMPQRGWDAVTVPGAVSAWRALSERFGRLPFADLFVGAINYAEHGFHVGPITAQGWGIAVKAFAERADFLHHFAPHGHAPHAGELFRRTDLARTLLDIAATHGASFYHGHLAEKLIAHSDAEGGAMTRDDLASHQPDWVTPLAQAFGEVELHEIPPNGQGLTALIALAILDKLGARGMDPDSIAAVHLQIEAIKLATTVAFRYFADPTAMIAPAATFLEPAWIGELAARVHPSRAAHVELPTLPRSHDTVYLTAADADGRMVSLIQSNFRGFGAGVVVPDTGISLQNRGAGFSLVHEHPNEVGPRKRPYHTIIPGFVTRGGAPLMSFGVMGGHMQPQGHVQMLMRICGAGQNPQAASDAPRWFVDETLNVTLEHGSAQSLAAGLSALGHTVSLEAQPQQLGIFGGAQLIYRMPDGAYCAASDHRKEGQAVGY